METLPTLHQVRAERCRRQFSEFFRQGWHVLEPSTPLSDNWHIDAVCDHLQALLDDWRAVQRAQTAGLPIPPQRLQNLVVNIPPGTAKSRMLSVYAPAWMWLEWPQWRAVYISGNPRVALRDSMFCRELIRSEWYQSLFQPSWGTSWRLSKSQDAKSFFRNTKNGLRLAIGAKSKITGDRFDFIGVDDPNDMATVESLAERDGVNSWWDAGAGNRVNDLRYSNRVLIQQRGHEDDMSGHVLPSGAWFHLIIPMEYEATQPGDDRHCKCPSCQSGVNPIGWRDPRTQAGELLDANRFPEYVLNQERIRLGTRGYAGQYQQRPAPAEGMIFKEAWFVNRYRSLPKLTDVGTIWDTALKDKEENDETACLTVGTGPDGNLYLVRMMHGRWETPDVAQFLIDQAYWLRKVFGDEYRGDYVEDKVSGTTLMQYVRRHVDADRRRAHDGSKLALIPIQTGREDKQARAHGVTPFCEALRVLLPDGEAYPATQAWVRDLLAQLLTFPAGAHDDIVDVFVYALKRFLGLLNKRKSRRGKAGGTL